MTDHGHSHGTGGGYERRDLSIKGIVIFAIAIALLVPITNLLMSALQDRITRSERSGDKELSPLVERGGEAAWRKVSTTRREIEQLQELRKSSRERLNSYGWVFKPPSPAQDEDGIAWIPIASAKRILLERGLPVREQPGGPGAGN